MKSGLEKLVEWFTEGICEGDGKLIMDKARALLAEEQANKPAEDKGTTLPKGRTCRSCLHTQKCKNIGVYNSDKTDCDFNPSRYAEYHSDMTPEPMFMREVCEVLGWQGGTVHEAIKEIKKLKELSRHRPAVNEEPLEELAKRKGHRLELAGWLYRPDGGLVVQRAENMVALRAYLESLTDVKGEGK